MEHIVTSAQFNAACSNLTTTKVYAEATMKGKEKEHKNQDEQLQFEEMSVLKTCVGRVDEDADKLMGESKTKPYSKLGSKRENVESLSLNPILSRARIRDDACTTVSMSFVENSRRCPHATIPPKRQDYR